MTVPELHETRYAFWSDELDAVVTVTIGEASKNVIVQGGIKKSMRWPMDSANPDTNLMPDVLRPFFEAAVRTYGAARVPLMRSEVEKYFLGVSPKGGNRD